ncbi:hypothetical protein HPB47_014786 [Ixodes persulcatus]|uniref:Uncharacterized protein n=1 Tax=Ixodes persulcatus TaxID=34615 RepID=A0AC60QV39_IXOPE|nr:hypothetical protein HPB47_014786 [Ixodes persulcatus]
MHPTIIVMTLVRTHRRNLREVTKGTSSKIAPTPRRTESSPAGSSSDPELLQTIEMTVAQKTPIRAAVRAAAKQQNTWKKVQGRCQPPGSLVDSVQMASTPMSQCFDALAGAPRSSSTGRVLKTGCTEVPKPPAPHVGQRTLWFWEKDSRMDAAVFLANVVFSMGNIGVLCMAWLYVLLEYKSTSRISAAALASALLALSLFWVAFGFVRFHVLFKTYTIWRRLNTTLKVLLVDKTVDIPA